MDLEQKLEAAAKSIADALAIAGVTVLAGMTADDKLLPRIICEARDAEGDDPRGSGNYHVPLRVHVESSATDDTLATHRTRCQQVFDEFSKDTLAATLSAAVADFHVIGVLHAGRGRTDQDGRFSNYLDVLCYCCGTDL